MKSLFVKVSMAVLTLAGVFAATPVLAGHVLDFQVLGKGSVFNDCIPLVISLPTGTCNIILTGQASGTHIGHDDFNLNLRVTGLSHNESNGVGGFCVVVTGILTLTPPSTATTISANVTGTVCEEGIANQSERQFDGTYRITEGTARFEDRSGGGSLTATYVHGAGGVVYLHLHGTLDR